MTGKQKIKMPMVGYGFLAHLWGAYAIGETGAQWLTGHNESVAI